ncbi:hypothetical protein ASPWEDRAFT_188509 [Aspergillus wentii DTO 134E9]|uniref:Uncharacterized protein n=1 Tax=Aspergillus wentii DTO 134E9 TaxID=1073089 RepID=A0A1L9R3R5_ASPWE|nr:uncharacterized protein ASPWEDRAFT_188509 [Aspergillus wentii DTO 134E9]KAI9923407.1 hypothetical protein MW887_009337 [Aspergillus wentii]OJJ29571.1 hypothetical protein ASPWEDRAFT_188509 [Aspergillus wentii DTO 134E9]
MAATGQLETQHTQHGVHLATGNTDGLYRTLRLPGHDGSSRRAAAALDPITMSATAKSRKQRARIFSGTILLAGTLATAVLAIILLANPSVKQGGIATFPMDWGHLGINVEQRGLPFPPDSPNIPGTVESAAQDGVTAVETQGIAAASAMTSAAESIATAAPHLPLGLAGVDLPKQLSIGTRMMCAQYRSDHQKCHQLPIEFSQIFPDPQLPLLGDTVRSFERLGEMIVTKVMGAAQHAVEAGLALAVVDMLTAFFFIQPSWARCRWVKWTILVLLSIACLACFLVSTSIIFVLQAKLGDLPTNTPFVESVHPGAAGRYSLGATCCAVVMFGCNLALAAL